MAKVLLDVSEENLGTLLLVLNNLKEGLVKKVEVNPAEVNLAGAASAHSSPSVDKKPKREPRYQPKANKVVYEEEQMGLVSRGKYLDPKSFKEKLQGRR